jgi:hypothetical protein
MSKWWSSSLLNFKELSSTFALTRPAACTEKRKNLIPSPKIGFFFGYFDCDSVVMGRW